MASKDKKPAPESSGAVGPAADPPITVPPEIAPLRGAVIQAGPTYPVLVAPTLVTPVHKYPTSLDLQDDAQRVLFFRALGRPDVNVPELAGRPFCVAHYLIHPDEDADPDTGEVTHFTRIKLIDPDGRVLETTGMGIIARLEALLILWPGRIGGAGIAVRVIEKRSRRQGMTYHDIEVVLPS